MTQPTPRRPPGRTPARFLCAAAVLALAGAARAEAPLVVLDPGHTPSHPGAASVRGTVEVDYNDAMVALLRGKLAAAGFRVEVTRQPGEELDLSGRARKANALRPWLFLSIHHDSAQPRYLEEQDRNGVTSARATKPIRGYSLFVSGENPHYRESLKVAIALGQRIAALGRAPTLHHAEPIPGEGRPLLDRKLGIYRYDRLKVLRETTCPAVLLEVGVLVDEADEAYVTDPAHREAIAGAIVDTLVDLRDAIFHR